MKTFVRTLKIDHSRIKVHDCFADLSVKPYKAPRPKYPSKDLQSVITFYQIAFKDIVEPEKYKTQVLQASIDYITSATCNKWHESVYEAVEQVLKARVGL